jgi:hypothetical protein
MSPPSSELKTKPASQQSKHVYLACRLSCWFPDWTVRRYSQEDRTLYKHRCENLRPYKPISPNHSEMPILIGGLRTMRHSFTVLHFLMIKCFIFLPECATSFYNYNMDFDMFNYVTNSRTTKPMPGNKFCGWAGPRANNAITSVWPCYGGYC